ncbi:hypothetical protein LIER_31234 [Lithospermum erythrorhizon]|uniref:Uncharacterized protein n=1 Tax=Lithospermum erythrorhizon TaxID=34254 RepID=A0AAV3RU11_LITER
MTQYSVILVVIRICASVDFLGPFGSGSCTCLALNNSSNIVGMSDSKTLACIPFRVTRILSPRLSPPYVLLALKENFVDFEAVFAFQVEVPPSIDEVCNRFLFTLLRGYHLGNVDSTSGDEEASEEFTSKLSSTIYGYWLNLGVLLGCCGF